LRAGAVDAQLAAGAHPHVVASSVKPSSGRRWRGRGEAGAVPDASPPPRVVGPVATMIGAGALITSLWALAEYWTVAVVFEPAMAIGGDAGSLESRIARARRSVLFGHHADYADVTMAERPEVLLAQFDRPLYHLLDTRLMMAYAKALAGAGHLPEAAHVAARLREFKNPASDDFFAACAGAATPLPFQCVPDTQLSVAQIRAMQGR
jgi:hypothetical protein